MHVTWSEINPSLGFTNKGRVTGDLSIYEANNIPARLVLKRIYILTW